MPDSAEKESPQDSRKAQLMMRERIKKQDYEAVFAHGCCYHFALCLHEKFGYKIRGIKGGDDSANPSHVWCLRGGDGKAVDIRGVYPEELIIQLADLGGPAYDISAEKVRNIIESKSYSPALERRIRKLANCIVDSHERFEAAKPPDHKRQAECLEDLKNASSKDPFEGPRVRTVTINK